jgi:hypothetical protein
VSVYFSQDRFVKAKDVSKMALMLHTEEPEYFEVDSPDGDSNQVDDGAEEATQEIAEATQEVAQSEPEAELERISDEEDFRIRIWNAEMRCRGREAVVEDLKEQLKDAKSAYEDAVTALRKLASESGGQPLPLFDAPKQAWPNSEAAVEPEAGTIAGDDESWRQKNFIEFIQSAGIDGLGKKKIDALSEVIQTFGDFQDLRNKASLEHLHLSRLLPSGFGEKVTDQIEQSFLDHQWNDSIEDPGYDDDPEPEYEDDNSDLESL